MNRNYFPRLQCFNLLCLQLFVYHPVITVEFVLHLIRAAVKVDTRDHDVRHVFYPYICQYDMAMLYFAAFKDISVVGQILRLLHLSNSNPHHSTKIIELIYHWNLRYFFHLRCCDRISRSSLGN